MLSSTSCTAFTFTKIPLSSSVEVFRLIITYGFIETLRLYPMVGSLNRECTLPYHIPNSSIVMEKGSKVVIPIAGLHNDPKFYPDPDTFCPERFANNNYKPCSTYMPFGDGPRICIGEF